MNIKSNTIFASALLGSLIFTLVIITILPYQFNKYQLTFKQQLKKASGFTYQYCNLDNELESELFITGQRDDVSYISYRNYDSLEISGGVIHEINWTVPFVKNSKPFFHDYDHDSINEAVVFFLKDSIVVLGVIDLYENETGGPYIAVDTIKSFRGQFNPVIKDITAYDINNDGYDEFIFTLINTHAVFPRTIYIVDTKKKKAKKGPKTAVAMTITDTLTTQNGESFYVVSTDALGNYIDTTFQYNDYNSYLMVFNDSLEFLFEPVVNKGFTSSVKSHFVHDKEYPRIVSLFVSPRASDESNTIKLFDLEGELIIEKDVGKDYRTLIQDKSRKPPRLLLYGKTSCIELDENLQEVNNFNIALLSSIIPYDVDNDLVNEFISMDYNNELLTIYRNDFKHHVSINFPFVASIPALSSKTNGNGTIKLAIDMKNFFLLYEYGKNPLYYYKYLIYISIFVINFIFLLLILFYNKRKVEERHKDEKRLINYQLLALKNQLDPHFALNTLNSIGYLYGQNNLKQANYLFERYSKLTRETLIKSNQISTTLSDEFSFVKNYLELEKYRNFNKFDFSIIVDEEINPDSIFMPRMLIHTFAENAVKHGLRHLENRQGQLDIAVSKKAKVITVIVKDNGIGRQLSKKYNMQSTGKGMGIAKEMIKLYNKLNNTKISYKIKDIENGTEVEVTFLKNH